MAWVEIMPGFETLFRDPRWDSPASFLDWTGILVNRHRTRQVEQVALPNGRTFFLKKEFAVSWRSLFRNAWHGFGWCSTVVREAATLQALRRAGVGCPEVVALGEDGHRAFMLTRDESSMTDLREILPILNAEGVRRLAEDLGAELARMHNAGFDHPDLFAKHILVAKAGHGFRVSILDWQRSRHRASVSWEVRCRDLAALDATLHPALADDRWRLRALRAYLQATIVEERVTLRWLAQQVADESEARQQDRNIREVGQPPTPAHDQQFVVFDAGRLLVVRSYHDRMQGRLPAWMREGRMPCHEEKRDAWQMVLAPVHDASNEAWEIPTLGHTLFRLQRFGIRAPRLIAVGRREHDVFLVIQRIVAIPYTDALAKATPRLRAAMLEQAGAVLRQLHDAGYSSYGESGWEHQLGIDAISGEVVLVNAEALLRTDAPWQEFGPVDLNRSDLHLGRSDEQCLLRGYLRESVIQRAIGDALDSGRRAAA